MKNFLILSAFLYSSISFGQHLERRIAHGFRLQPTEINGTSRMQVAALSPTGTAGVAGLQMNDILLEVNSTEVFGMADLQSDAISNLREGAEVVYTVIRNGETLELSASGVPIPMESGDSHKTEYFEIPFDGGWLRAIANLPEGEGPFPTIYFIQGYTCSPIESQWPGHPYRRLAKTFTDAGIAFVRVEKPGVGDSYGMDPCMETDFNYEVESFTEAGQFVRDLSWVDTTNFYIFGHSMGGYLAPIVASEVPTQGIAVYGTRHEPWREYFLQMWRFQLVRQGFSYAEVESRMKDYYELAYLLFFQRHSPTEISASHPHLNDELEDGLLWDGENIVLFRNYDALQSVDDLPVVPSWLEYQGKVLVMYGTADFEVCSDESPREMVRMINLEGKGKAEYVEIQGADHSMFPVRGMEEAVNMEPAELRSIQMSGIENLIPNSVVRWMTEK